MPAAAACSTARAAGAPGGRGPATPLAAAVRGARRCRLSGRIALRSVLRLLRRLNAAGLHVVVRNRVDVASWRRARAQRGRGRVRHAAASGRTTLGRRTASASASARTVAGPAGFQTLALQPGALVQRLLGHLRGAARIAFHCPTAVLCRPPGAPPRGRHCAAIPRTHLDIARAAEAAAANRSLLSPALLLGVRLGRAGHARGARAPGPRKRRRESSSRERSGGHGVRSEGSGGRAKTVPDDCPDCTCPCFRAALRRLDCAWTALGSRCDALTATRACLHKHARRGGVAVSHRCAATPQREAAQQAPRSRVRSRG
jgi:hypothetical protein